MPFAACTIRSVGGIEVFVFLAFVWKQLQVVLEDAIPEWLIPDCFVSKPINDAGAMNERASCCVGQEQQSILGITGGEGSSSTVF